MKKISILILVFVFLFSGVVFALTADEYYERAAKKYVMEDLEGAKTDLGRALEIDPTHEKAQELLGVVEKEMGKIAPPVPPAVIAPTPPAPPEPKPAPPVERPKPRVPSKIQRASNLFAAGERAFKRGEYSEAEKYFLQVLELLPGHTRATEYLKEIRKKIEPVKPKLIPPPPAPEISGVEETVNQIILLFLAVFILAFLLVLRGGYSAIKRIISEKRKQVCPDCKTKNPEDAEFCQKCGIRLRVWAVVTKAHRKWFDKFGWKGNPFTLDVIPSLFTGYSAQVDAIVEKLSTRTGHILVYGDKGVGKTTLLRWLADNLKKDNHAIYVARPPLNFDDLIRLVVAELKGGRRKYSLYELEELVKKAKKPVVVLLDEAHEIAAEIEQQMRSLGDIQKVNLILAGLPETREKIKRESPPFFDRMVLETTIDHLNLEETRDLIRKRIESVGGNDIKPLTDEAVENIFNLSKGRPRMILKVCDWVMTDAIRKNLDVIGPEAGKDFPGLEATFPE